MHRTVAPLLAVALLAAAGCGLHDPYATHRATQTSTSTPASPSTASTDTQDNDGPPLPATAPLALGGAARTPLQALKRYGQLYINWNYQNLPAVQRQLASISEGQARQQALASANHHSRDLTRYQVTNSGQVTGIAAGQGTERGKWAVVCDEQTSGQGPYLGLPVTTDVTWATVRHQADGWVITGWYPAGAAPP